MEVKCGCRTVFIQLFLLPFPFVDCNRMLRWSETRHCETRRSKISTTETSTLQQHRSSCRTWPYWTTHQKRKQHEVFVCPSRLHDASLFSCTIFGRIGIRTRRTEKSYNSKGNRIGGWDLCLCRARSASIFVAKKGGVGISLVGPAHGAAVCILFRPPRRRYTTRMANQATESAEFHIRASRAKDAEHWQAAKP